MRYYHFIMLYPTFILLRRSDKGGCLFFKMNGCSTSAPSPSKREGNLTLQIQNSILHLISYFTRLWTRQPGRVHIVDVSTNPKNEFGIARLLLPIIFCF